MPDPLKIKVFCGSCWKLFQGKAECTCGAKPQEWVPMIELRLIPEDVIEELRAKHLEANMVGGARRLTDEEITRRESEAVIEGTGHEIDPDPRPPAEPELDPAEETARQELEGWG